MVCDGGGCGDWDLSVGCCGRFADLAGEAVSARHPRSPEARKRRAAKVRAVVSGRRVACDRCKTMHPPPECDPLAESVTLPVVIAPWLYERMKAEVEWGERSPWIVSLIRKELGV